MGKSAYSIAVQQMGEIITKANLNAAAVEKALEPINAQLAETASGLINVVNGFGADPTGVEDSTAAINAALLAAKGKTIFLPPGIYKTTATIVLPSDTTIIGYGATIVPIDAGLFPLYQPINDAVSVDLTWNSRPIFSNSTPAEGNSNIAIYGLKWIGNNIGSPSMHGLHVFNISGLIVENCITDECLSPIAVLKSTDVRIIRNSVKNFRNGGIDTWHGCKRVQILHNIVDCEAVNVDGSNIGIFCTAEPTDNELNPSVTEDYVIAHNIVMNAESHGIWVGGGSASFNRVNDHFKRILVHSNIVRDCGQIGIILERGEDCSLRDNTIINTGYHGIFLRKAVSSGTTFVDRPVIADNIIRNAGLTVADSKFIHMDDAVRNAFVYGNKGTGTSHTYALYDRGTNSGLTYYGNSFDPGTNGTYNILSSSPKIDPKPDGTMERIGPTTAGIATPLFNAALQGAVWEVILSVQSAGATATSYARFMVYGNTTTPKIHALETFGTTTYTLSLNGTNVEAFSSASTSISRYIWRKI